MDKVLSYVSSKVVYNLNFFNFNIPITDTIISMWKVTLIIIIIAIILSRKIKTVPGKRQSLVEMYITMINNLISDAFEKNSQDFVPFIGTMFLFLLLANMIDIVNIVIPSANLVPPTKDINIVLAFSIITMISVIYAGIKYTKLSGWLKSFIKPVPIILPFKILDYVTKPISLTLRMFGNILAGFLILIVLYSLVPAVLPSVASLYFDLFDGALQAYIFVFLTSLYIGEAINIDD